MYKILYLFLLLPICCLAQQGGNLSLISRYMQGEHLQGFNGNVLIAKNGKILYQKAFGYSDFSSKLPLNNSSIFELASVSKQFTAMGILQLKEKGKLKLTDSLRAFFPELPYQKITIYNLLTHTSGLPDYLSEMDTKWNHKKIAFNKDIIHFLASEKPALNFTPGSRYDYSNTGYVLLACIIEKLTGQTYNNYLDQNIFTPLGMHNSRVYNSRRSKHDIINNYAYGYVLDNKTNAYVLPDSLKQDDFVYWLDGVTGDGTVNSTTSDLLKWNNALLHHLLLNQIDQTDMLSPHTLTDTLTKRYYGYGVEIGQDELGDFITHDGSWPGYSTVLSQYKSGDYTIIALSNNQHNSVAVSRALAYILNNKPVIFPYRHKQIVLDAGLLDKYIGEYTFPIKLNIIKRDGKLYRHIPGRSATSDVELKPESTTKFFYGNNADIQIQFELNKQNQIEKVTLINYGLLVHGERIN
ncbi:MAG: serine hydrolase [Mucilaginibacter sp.]